MRARTDRERNKPTKIIRKDKGPCSKDISWNQSSEEKMFLSMKDSIQKRVDARIPSITFFTLPSKSPSCLLLLTGQRIGKNWLGIDQQIISQMNEQAVSKISLEGCVIASWEPFLQCLDKLPLQVVNNRQEVVISIKNCRNNHISCLDQQQLYDLMVALNKKNIVVNIFLTNQVITSALYKSIKALPFVKLKDSGFCSSRRDQVEQKERTGRIQKINATLNPSDIEIHLPFLIEKLKKIMELWEEDPSDIDSKLALKNASEWDRLYYHLALEDIDLDDLAALLIERRDIIYDPALDDIAFRADYKQAVKEAKRAYEREHELLALKQKPLATPKHPFFNRKIAEKKRAFEGFAAARAKQNTFSTSASEVYPYLARNEDKNESLSVFFMEKMRKTAKTVGESILEVITPYV